MNLLQANIAHKINAHFKRQMMCMHRDGPVERIKDDQDTLVNDLVGLFSHQNNLFDREAFISICNKL